jgi:hypothetical protein
VRYSAEPRGREQQGVEKSSEETTLEEEIRVKVKRDRDIGWDTERRRQSGEK